MTQDLCREVFSSDDFQRTLDAYLAVRDRTPNPVILAALEMAANSENAAWSQRVPDGMVVVPVEPTEEMILAGIKYRDEPEADQSCEPIFRAMIAPFVKGE